MEKLPERKEFELEDKKNEYVDRFLYLSREYKRIDDEIFGIYVDIQQECGISLEEAVREHESNSLKQEFIAKLDMEYTGIEN